MRHLFLVGSLIVSANLSTACPAAAQDEVKVEQVHFSSGRNSATIRGTIKGWQVIDYHLGAKAGQTIRVTLKGSNGSNYFNVNTPGADEAMFTGATSGEDFTGVLPKDGEYTMRVYLMRNEARRGTRATYDISFSITGP